jgi:hypothetical protein
VSLSTPAKVAAFTLITAIATVACTNSREGQRCDVKNGNDDCVEGLKCVRAGELNNVTSDRCCPVDTTLATDPACVVAQASVSGDAGTSTPFDSGAAEAGNVSDAASGGEAATPDAASVSDAASD